MFSALTQKYRWPSIRRYMIMWSKTLDVCSSVLYLYSYNSLLHLQIAWINHVVVFTSRDGHIMTPKYTQYQKGVRPVASNLLWALSTSVTDVITKNISFVLCNPTIVEIYMTTLPFLLYVFL